MTEEQH